MIIVLYVECVPIALLFLSSFVVFSSFSCIVLHASFFGEQR